MTTAEIAHRLGARKVGGGWIARCIVPGHYDRTPSLAICEGEGGKVLAHCHGGCDQQAVITALMSRGLWPERGGTDRHVVATYDYTDAEGKLLYQIVRKAGKRFQQRRPDGAGGWVWKKHPHQVLYRLPEVLEAAIIFVVEGEKDVETLRDHGFVATTNAGGATAAWLPGYTDALRGREVILIPDRDDPGRARAKRIVGALLGHVARLVYLELEDGKDVSEWFGRGHSEVELIEQLEGQFV